VAMEVNMHHIYLSVPLSLREETKACLAVTGWRQHGLFGYGQRVRTAYYTEQNLSYFKDD
jgi:hypothetical protein